MGLHSPQSLEEGPSGVLPPPQAQDWGTTPALHTDENPVWAGGNQSQAIKRTSSGRRNQAVWEYSNERWVSVVSINRNTPMGAYMRHFY
jgi:hypothetical protein